MAEARHRDQPTLVTAGQSRRIDLRKAKPESVDRDGDGCRARRFTQYLPQEGKFVMILTALLLGLSVAEGQSADQDESYYLNGQGFNCLVHHIERIARRRGRRLTIDLQPCPSPPRVTARLNAWPNLRQSQISPSAIDTMIVLTRAEIGCIRAHRRRPEPLREAAGNDRYRLRLSICAR